MYMIPLVVDLHVGTSQYTQVHVPVHLQELPTGGTQLYRQLRILLSSQGQIYYQIQLEYRYMYVQYGTGRVLQYIYQQIQIYSCSYQQDPTAVPVLYMYRYSCTGTTGTYGTDSSIALGIPTTGSIQYYQLVLQIVLATYVASQGPSRLATAVLVVCTYRYVLVPTSQLARCCIVCALNHNKSGECCLDETPPTAFIKHILQLYLIGKHSYSRSVSRRGPSTRIGGANPGKPPKNGHPQPGGLSSERRATLAWLQGCSLASIWISLASDTR